MKKGLKKLVNRFEIDIFADPDDPGWFCARVPDIPTIFTGGATPEEALRAAQEAIEGYLELCEEDGLPVCEPTSVYTEELSVHLPKDVHRTLMQRAEREGLSVQEVIGEVLRSELHGQRAQARKRPSRSKRP